MAYKITIRGYIGWDENATPEFLEKELKAANGDAIDVEFSSGGGSVFAGLEMANMIKNYTGRVVAKITGLAASMSSYIPMMADEIIVEDNAVFMIHNVSTFAWGDYRDLEKVARHIKGLRDILAKAYVSKTKKSLSDIQGLMDDESFFYGDEIVEAGFADSVIKVATDGDDKDTAVALAQEDIKNCVAVMKDNESKFADDFERAAAFLNKEVPKPPAAAGKTQKEAAKMNLKELLAANPDAKAEYDAAIVAAETKARTEGETAGKIAGKEDGMAQMKTAFTAALPILASASYPETVKERVTAKAVAGDIEGLKDFVAMHDMNTEAAAAKAAADEAAADTLPQGDHNQGLSTDGMINNAADLDAAAAQLKTEYGVGGTK